MRAIIDRFEGRYAVVEVEGTMRNIAKADLPVGVQEGDVLDFANGRWNLLPDETARIKKKIDKMAQGLWED